MGNRILLHNLLLFQYLIVITLELVSLPRIPLHNYDEVNLPSFQKQTIFSLNITSETLQGFRQTPTPRFWLQARDLGGVQSRHSRFSPRVARLSRQWELGLGPEEEVWPSPLLEDRIRGTWIHLVDRNYPRFQGFGYGGRTRGSCFEAW